MSAIITKEQFDELLKRVDKNIQDPTFSWDNLYQVDRPYVHVERTKKNQYLRLNDLPKSVISKIPTTFIDYSNIDYYDPKLVSNFINHLVHIASDFVNEPKLQNKSIVFFERITRMSIEKLIVDAFESNHLDYYSFIPEDSQKWISQAYNLFETNNSYEMRLLCVKDQITGELYFTLMNSNKNNTLLLAYRNREVEACIGHQTFRFKNQNRVEAQIFGFGDDISDVMTQLKSALSADNIAKINQIIGSVNDAVENKDQLAETLSDKVQSMCENVGKDVLKKIAISLCIVGLFISLRDKSYSIAAISMAILAYAHRDEIGVFLSKYTIFQKLTELVNRQVNVDQVELDAVRAEVGMTSYVSEIATAMSLFIVGKESKNSNIFTGDSLRLFGTAKMAVQNIINLVLTVIETVIYNAGYGDKYEKVFMLTQNSDPVYRDFTEKVFNIDDCYREKKLTFTYDNYSLIKETLSEGQKLMRDLPKTTATQGLVSTMHSALQRLTTYAKAFMDSGFMTEGLRQEPVAILLQGGPGTLKTQTMQHMAHALCSAVVEESKRSAFETTPERFIYNRMIESEYWDKYNSDKIVCMFDDFLQIRDVAGGGDSEVFNIIRAVNEQNYDLHMADLADKGNTSFQCKFVICTSNSEKLDVQSIHDKGALLRRFKFTYIPVPRDEYKKLDHRTNMMAQKVNMQKLPIGELGISSTNPDEVLDFHEINLMTGKPTGRICNFEEVVLRMLDAYEFNKKCYEQKLIELKNQRKKYAKYAIRPEISFWKREIVYEIPEAITNESIEYFVELTNNLSDEKRSFLMARVDRLEESRLPELKRRLATLINSIDCYKTDMSVDDILSALLDNFTVRDNLFNFNNPIEDIVNVIKHDEEFNSYIWVTCDELPERGLMESLKDRFKDSISSIKGYMSKDKEYLDFVSWKNALLAATTMASIVAIFYSFKMFGENRDLKEIMRNPEEAEGDYKLKQAKKKAPRRDIKSLRKAMVQSQISLVSDKQGEHIVEKILRHNVYEFSSRKSADSEWTKLGFVTFLKGTIAIMPRHFIDALAYRLEEEPETVQNAEFRLRGTVNANEGCKTIMLSIADIMYDLQETPVLKDQDLILVNLPDVQPRRDIMKYIMTEKDLASLGRKPVCILGKTGKMMSTVQTHGKTMERVLVNDVDLEPYEIKTTMAYNVATSKGDCGTILGVLSPSLPNRKICGIHVAGSPHQNMGYSSLFSYEMIEECLELFDAEHKISCNVDDVQSEFGTPLVGDGRFDAYRDAPVAPSLASRTVIIPSRMQGQLSSPYMKPAKLRAERVGDEIRDPWKYAMANYRMDVPILKKDVIDAATDQYQDFLFHSAVHEEEKRLYTFEEAVVGIPNTEFESINRRTSPGYPDVVMKPKDFKGKGKELFFGNEADFNLDGDYCQMLKARVLNSIDQASKGVRSEHIFMDCLKDELRPIEKADGFKTRLISASSIDLLILYRMYFGAYQLWYKRNRVFNQSAIGVNVYSQEWDMIAKHLERFSPGDCKNVGAGDYSKFDGTEKPYIHKKILEVINNWYDDGEENFLIRKVLWLELTNSIHIQGKCIYEWGTSLPSGHPLTPVVNTMYNGIAFRYCWNRAFDFDPMLKTQFNDYCYLIAMGDDNVFSVHGKYSKIFTEVTVGKYMSELGLVYTSETKDVVNVEMRHLTEVEFLKRRWRKCSKVGRYVAPHQIERQLEILNWSKRGANADEISIDNVDSVLRELALHGSEVYNFWSKKIATVSQQNLGYFPKVMSFSQNLSLICNQENYC